MSEHVGNLPWHLGPFDWLPTAEPTRIDASASDSSERPIGIAAFVEDTRARTPYGRARLPGKTEYHIKVGESVVNLWIQGTTEGLLSSVLLGTIAVSPTEALDRCGSLLLSLLSSWSFQIQRPLAVRELRVEDKTHGAKWELRPQAQDPLQLNEITVSLGGPNPIGSLLALFREGMASVQPAYRFLCYYKIIEAWKEGHGPFAQVNKMFADQGRKPPRRTLRVDAALFAGNCDPNRYEHLLGKKFGWCFEQMNDARRYLAHPFDSHGEFVSLDSPKTLQALSDCANLAERMAVEILVDEIRVIKSLDTSGTSDRVIAGYVHESWGRDLLGRTDVLPDKS